MPRRPRYSPINIPQHVIQRGHDRQACFLEPYDYRLYLKLLKQFSGECTVLIHAWVLMSNHVHLLVTPKEENSLSHMMHSIAHRYAQYFNRKYKRSGGLWERRFRNCVIDNEEYLLHCYLYVELNPVRAEMVQMPADYRWSSFHENAGSLGRVIVTPHELFLALAPNAMDLKKAYRALLMRGLGSEELDVIRRTGHRGGVIKG